MEQTIFVALIGTNLASNMLSVLHTTTNFTDWEYTTNIARTFTDTNETYSTNPIGFYRGQMLECREFTVDEDNNDIRRLPDYHWTSLTTTDSEGPEYYFWNTNVVFELQLSVTNNAAVTNGCDGDCPTNDPGM